LTRVQDPILEKETNKFKNMEINYDVYRMCQMASRISSITSKNLDMALTT
jgi:hypothetical protein